MPKFLIETRIDVILQEIIEADNEEQAESKIGKGTVIERGDEYLDILDCYEVTDKEAKAIIDGSKTLSPTNKLHGVI